jgi:hypothetical protein
LKKLIKWSTVGIVAILIVGCGASSHNTKDSKNAKKSSILLGSYDIPCAGDFAISNDGKKAYLLAGNHLDIVDISNPSNLSKIYKYTALTQITKGAYPMGIEVSADGKKLYVADLAATLAIIDVSNPEDPRKLNSYIAASSDDVILSKNNKKAYVTHHDGSVTIVDMEDINSPTKTSTLAPAKSVSSMALSNNGKTAYLVGKSGLAIMDVSDHTNPVKIGSYSDAVNIMAISSDGKRAYLTGKKSELIIVDISSRPAYPTKLGSYADVGTVDVEFYDAAVSNDGKKLYIVGKNVSKGKNGIVVIDITDPKNPVRLNSHNIKGLPTWIKLSSDGTKAYISGCSKTGFRILDLTLFD